MEQQTLLAVLGQPKKIKAKWLFGLGILLAMCCASCQCGAGGASTITYRDVSKEIVHSVAFTTTNEERPAIEVRFFAEELTPSQIVTVAKQQDGYLKIEDELFVGKITIVFTKGSPNCDNPDGYIVFFKRTKQTPHINLENNLDTWFVSFNGRSGSSIPNRFGIDSIQCADFAVGSKISFKIRYQFETRSPSNPNTITGIQAKWDLDVTTTIQSSQ